MKNRHSPETSHRTHKYTEGRPEVGPGTRTRAGIFPHLEELKLQTEPWAYKACMGLVTEDRRWVKIRDDARRCAATYGALLLAGTSAGVRTTWRYFLTSVRMNKRLQSGFLNLLPR